MTSCNLLESEISQKHVRLWLSVYLVELCNGVGVIHIHVRLGAVGLVGFTVAVLARWLHENGSAVAGHWPTGAGLFHSVHATVGPTQTASQTTSTMHPQLV